MSIVNFSVSKSIIKFYQDNNMDELFHPEPVLRVNSPKPLNKVQHTTQSNENTPQTPALHPLNHIKTLEELYQTIRDFNGCELKKTANTTVIYDGSASSPIMFVGEAPGRNEDEQGIPFCGQSGKLLDLIIPCFGYTRPEVYITNTVFWRPPMNRRPTPQEIETCRPFVEKLISLVSPKFIILVGSTAVESLLGQNLPMHAVRQKIFSYNNPCLTSPIKTYAIFHPSYLLRQPLKKKECFEDIQFILNNM